MREIALMVRGNIRKSKSAFLGIAIMMFIVSLSLTITLSIVINTEKRDMELMESTGLGHIISAQNWNWQEEYYEEYEARCEKLAENIRKNEEVERVELIPTLFLNISDVNGKEGNSTCSVFSMETSGLHYNVYDGQGKKLENLALHPGEIIVPNSFIALYDAEIGDEVVLASYQENKTVGALTEKSFKIVAYMEDPYMGSSIMGVKTLLISETDAVGYVTEESLAKGLTLNVFQKETSSLTDTEFETLLNKETAYGSNAWISFTRTQLKSYMTMLTDIFSGILIAFVTMIVVATLIVLNNSISSSIELDFVDLGILKAVGVSNSKLRLSILIGYMLAAISGAVLGIPLAIPLIAIINNLINPTIGLYGDNTPCVGLCALVLLVILLIFALFIVGKLSKLRKISPVKAINSGRADVHFSGLLKLPVSKKGLSLSLAYRQFSAEKKQYGAAIFITAILVWVMVMVTDMCSWFGDGGERLNESFSIVEYDMGSYSSSLEMEEQLREIIYKHDPKAERFIAGNKYVLLNDTQIMCFICDEPQRFNVYKGRTCLYDNEIVITEYIVENYGLDIGDTVTINVDGTEKEFLITGYFVCANDAGKCIGIHYDTYDSMRKKTAVPEGEEPQVASTFHYKLSNPDLAEGIAAEVSSKFEEEEASISLRDSFGGMEMVIVGVWGLAVLIYIISGVFVAVTVVMICSKIFAKEKADFGIYKAMGFTSKNLRNMFSIRFAIVALVGALLGIVLAFLFSGMVIGSIFKLIGLYNFESSLSLVSLVMPVVFATIVYYVVAYVTSRKMKKLSPTVLISE